MIGIRGKYIHEKDPEEVYFHSLFASLIFACMQKKRGARLEISPLTTEKTATIVFSLNY